jgi:hypothetical protein
MLAELPLGYAWWAMPIFFCRDLSKKNLQPVYRKNKHTQPHTFTLHTHTHTTYSTCMHNICVEQSNKNFRLPPTTLDLKEPCKWYDN